MQDLSPPLIARVVERFKALADENRIRLLIQLRQEGSNVTALTRRLQMNQASVSKHLTVLKRVGLVKVQRQGTQAIYSIDDRSVFDLCQHVCNGVIRQLQKEQTVLSEVSTTTRNRKGKKQ
jgi:DNA-binding transcriptional ArsR family regulator